MSRCNWLLFLALAAGCGGGDGSLIPVTGIVKNADGSPVDFQSGSVVFTPAGPTKSATGSVDKDGSFAMMTQKPGDGVAPGDYKVVLQLWKNYRDQTLAVPDKYGEAATTPLEATVDAEHTTFEFKVEK